MTEAIIRVDVAPAGLPSVPPTYVTGVGAMNHRGLRSFEFTHDRRAAQRFPLRTAAEIIRELGPTVCQFSVCDAGGMTAAQFELYRAKYERKGIPA